MLLYACLGTFTPLFEFTCFFVNIHHLVWLYGGFWEPPSPCTLLYDFLATSTAFYVFICSFESSTSLHAFISFLNNLLPLHAFICFWELFPLVRFHMPFVNLHHLVHFYMPLSKPPTLCTSLYAFWEGPSPFYVSKCMLGTSIHFYVLICLFGNLHNLVHLYMLFCDPPPPFTRLYAFFRTSSPLYA